MKSKIFMLLAMIAAFVATPSAHAVTGSNYPSLIEQNQFGEKSINSVVGGSGMLDCSFTVAATDAAGKGITGLSGAPCSAVFMHTSQTPATGSPNPANGLIYVKLASQAYKYVGGYAQFASPNSGTPINVTTGVTAGGAYVITSLGNTALSGWTNLGLAAGVTPAVGAAFIAPGTTVSTGTGQIQAPATAGAGVQLIDVIGDASVTAQATSGAVLTLRVLGATNSSTTTLVATAPAAGSVIKLRFVMLPLSSQLH